MFGVAKRWAQRASALGSSPGLTPALSSAGPVAVGSATPIPREPAGAPISRARGSIGEPSGVARNDDFSVDERRAGLEGVSVRYGDTTVLDDVSLRVMEGEAVCLVGPSGGGKSTILNLLAGLVKPTRGSVLFRGRPVTGPGPERAVVFQDAALFAWLTLEQNVSFPLELAGVPEDERRARVEELLRLVHLFRFRGLYPHELSGGMRQRGAIARALATRPSMLLFDEPFAALDGQMRELLQNEVERIVKAARTTMVFVTHQIDEAVRLGDRVVLVGSRPGRILGDVHVDLPRPRRNDDARAQRITASIAASIRAEVEKVAREEADGAWGIAGSSDGGDPRRHLGRGI